MRPESLRLAAGPVPIHGPADPTGALLERPANRGPQLLLLEWFREVVRRPELHGRDRGPDGLYAGQHDDRKVRLQRFELLQDLEPIDVGHEDVEEDEINAL